MGKNTDVEKTDLPQANFAKGFAGVLLIVSILFCSNGIWQNFFGALGSPFSLISLAGGYLHNAVSDEYIPVDINSSGTTPIHLERATRQGLTGKDTYANATPASFVRQGIYSLLIWVSLGSFIVSAKKISEKRKNSNSSATTCIARMASCFLATFIISQITVYLFSFISFTLMFVIAGIASSRVYLAADAATA